MEGRTPLIKLILWVPSTDLLGFQIPPMGWGLVEHLEDKLQQLHERHEQLEQEMQQQVGDEKKRGYSGGRVVKQTAAVRMRAAEAGAAMAGGLWGTAAA
eukprot:1159489-Pelagomonas_calceolata.AAC.1